MWAVRGNSRQLVRRASRHNRHILFLPGLLSIYFGIVFLVVFEYAILWVDLLDVIRQVERLQRNVLVLVCHGCWLFHESVLQLAFIVSRGDETCGVVKDKAGACV